MATLPSSVSNLSSILGARRASVQQRAVCFLAIIPLEGMFDWGGEQIALYLGKDLGDLVIVTLNK